MDDFVGLDIVSLRKILCQTIIESCGRDYALGWLQSAYSYANASIDEDRDGVIAQIVEYRARKDTKSKF